MTYFSFGENVLLDKSHIDNRRMLQHNHCIDPFEDHTYVEELHVCRNDSNNMYKYHITMSMHNMLLHNSYHRSFRYFHRIRMQAQRIQNNIFHNHHSNHIEILQTND